MKKWFVTLLALVALGTAGLAIAAVENGKITLKVGDVVNVCGCGEGCPCDTISRMEGKCSCGKALVKGKVTKVEEGMAMIEVNGKELPFKTTGKYQCMCGKRCKCDTISQRPGKCGCGMEMQEIK